MKKGAKKNLRKSKKLLKILLIIVIVFIALFIVKKIFDSIVFDKNENTNLVINNKNVTSNLKHEIKFENDEIYISMDDLKNFFDKYIYQDKENNNIVTTYNTKLATISMENNKMTVNGSSKKINAHAKEEDNVIYIPINELKDVYGIEITNISNTKIITIDSKSKEQKKAIINKNTNVKSSTKFISKTVAKAKKQSYAIIISEEKGYTKIRTENGKIGYVKSKRLSNITTVRENMTVEKPIDGKVNLVWDYYSEYVNAPDRTDETMNGVNVVSPSFFHLNEDGTILDNAGEDGKKYITWAHSQGYKVWPMLQNDGIDIKVTSEIMNSYNNRIKLIKEIEQLFLQYSIDGINIDFENMKEEDKDMYSRFIIELTPMIKDINIKYAVSVDVTAPDGSSTWSLCFDRNVIGDVADYIVFMAYDEYGASSTKSGTTAGYDWVKTNLNKFINTESIDGSKIILAIPLYTRLWTEDSSGEVTKKSAVSIKSIDKVLPTGLDKQWKDDVRQYYVEYQDEGSTKKMWIEDEKSLKEKISLIKENNLAGVGSWAKDMEYDGFWDFLKEQMQ